MPRGFKLQNFSTRLRQGPSGDPGRRGGPSQTPLPSPPSDPPSPCLVTGSGYGAPGSMMAVGRWIMAHVPETPAAEMCLQCHGRPLQPRHRFVSVRPPPPPFPAPLSLQKGIEGATAAVAWGQGVRATVHGGPGIWGPRGPCVRVRGLCVVWGGGGGAVGRGVLKEPIFFCEGPPLRTAPRDHQPPTANCQPPPTANHQPPTANRHQPPTANCQPPPTAYRQPPIATNRQLPIATNHQPPPTATNRHQPPTADCHRPWLGI